MPKQLCVAGWTALARAVGVASCFLVGFAVPVTAGPPPADWALVFVRADSQGATGVTVADWHNVVSSETVTSSGFAFADPTRHAAFGLVLPETAPGVSVSTTRSLGGEHLTLVRKPSTGSLGVSGFLVTMKPHELAVMLIFYAGGHFSTGNELTTATKTGRVTVTSVSGHGSQQWLLATAGDDGVGLGESSQASAVRAGAGVGRSVVHAAAQRVGVVGGFVWARSIGLQQWTWNAPDGRSGTTRAVTAPQVSRTNSAMFAGPSGRWTWVWTGAFVDNQEAVLGAWAEVGRYWKLFDQPHFSA
jgi:hypothetical protein